MPRCSSCFFVFFNVLILLGSVLTILLAVALGREGITECNKLFQIPILAQGIFWLAASVVGLIGTCCRVRSLLRLYLVMLLVLMVVLFGSTMLGFVVTNKVPLEELVDTSREEYRLGDFSEWLQKNVVSAEQWKSIKGCLSKGNICQKLHRLSPVDPQHVNYEGLYVFSTIQSGCCRPPTVCGLEHENATLSSSSNPDCKTWSNQKEELCYNCDACKAGYLRMVQIELKEFGYAGTAQVFLAIIIFAIGCCVARNSRDDSYYRSYP